MLVEKTAFEVDPTFAETTTSTPTLAGAKTSKSRTSKPRQKKGGAKHGAAYAILHGQKRGTRSGAHDTILVAEEPPISDDAPGEGLYVFIQTTVCRRQVLTKIYGNKPSSKSAQKFATAHLLTEHI
jgi:hypothetical protein